MSWGRLRLIVFSISGTALLLVGALVRAVTVERAGIPLLVALSSLGGVMMLVVVFDVAYHAWRGGGQACRHCGHHRRMKPFRLYGACPRCGES